MLESFTLETFAGRLGEQFNVAADAGAIEVELAEANALHARRDDKRVPFSLVFRGPADPVLPQSTYAFEHPELGAFEIFVVPIGRDERGVSYEAVFS